MNVLLHAQRARERVKANGKPNGELHDVLHHDLPLPWWRKLFKWENLTVAGRNIEKGLVLTPPMVLLLIATFLGALGYAYKSSTADSRETRDAVIRMETMLNERTRNFERQQDKMEQKLDNEVKLGEMRREQEATKRATLLATLRQKGIVID